MNETAARAFRNTVMHVPTPERRHATSALSVPYSRKMGQRVYAYEDEGYALWLELEFDAGIQSFNLEPQPLTVAHGDKSFNVAMVGASVDRANHLTLHFRQATLELTAGDVLARQLIHSQQWDASNTSVREWGDLTDVKRIDRANKATLLRYICAPQVVSNALVERRIHGVLKNFRKLCVWDVLQTLKDLDEEDVKTAIAHLVVEKKIFLDMTVRFSVHSGISSEDIFHA